ncbi:FecR family protein [Zobellia nedashkovskayae]
MEFKLILKKLNKTLSEEEATIFSEWYNESELHKSYFMKVQENYHNETFLIDIEKGWKAVEKQIKPAAVKKTSYLNYAVAASIVLLISITFLIKKEKIEEVVNPVITNNNIKIGTDKATLTLEDGAVVALEKGGQYISDNLESNGEELIYKTLNTSKKEIAYNYLTVPRGGQYHIVLSDGTKVWLNSESQLKYPISFTDGKSRQVELVYGEAFFDVSSSSNHKGSHFKVLNQFQEVEVLGTKFNIKAYKNETDVYTYLVEGKVAVNTVNTNEVLAPGEQSNLNRETSEITVRKGNSYRETSWKDGIFSFKHKSLKDIMVVLSRWYDMEVIFKNKELENVTFTGTLYKNQSIEEILTFIQGSILTYEINNKTITFK